MVGRSSEAVLLICVAFWDQTMANGHLLEPDCAEVEEIAALRLSLKAIESSAIETLRRKTVFEHPPG